MSMTPESAIVCVKMMFAFWANAHGLNVAEMEEAKDLAVEALRAYPPAHIDREAWEPCEVCGEKDPFGNPKFSHHFVVDESSLYFCDSDFGWEGEKIKFCPFCSRPLTEEAWAELEKRMGVMG